jgi:hypothetical protein
LLVVFRQSAFTRHFSIGDFILAVFSFIMLTLAERKALREALADDDVPTPGFLFGEINSMATGLIKGGCGWF